MKYLSVCSGIEAATVAWHGLGWTPVAFSEIEAFPAAVLAHHYPTVPNLGDLTKYREWPEELLVEVDLLVGGTPCQAFSVAGKRQSLDDERGNLSLIYVNLYHHINEVRKRHGRPPAIALWENVPGVLSTKDNAFGCFIGGMLGCDEAPATESGKWDKAGFLSSETVRVGYRILDAQYFGVAQRRRRVFLAAVPCELVERFGERACPSEILSLRESVLGNPPTRGAAWEGAAGAAPGGAASGGGCGEPFYLDRASFNQVENAQYEPQITNDGVAAAAAAVARGPGAVMWSASDQANAERLVDQAGTLNCNMGQRGGWIAGHPDPAYAIPAGNQSKGGVFGSGRDSQDTFVTCFHPTQDPISSTDGSTHAVSTGSGGGCATHAVCVTGQRSHALTTRAAACEEDGTGRGTPIVTHGGVFDGAVAFKPGQSEAAGGTFVTEEFTPTMQAQNNGSTAVPAVAYGIRGDAGREGVAKTPSADAEGMVRLRNPSFNPSEELCPTIDSSQPHAVAFTKAKRAQSATDDESWVPGDVAPTQNQFDQGDTRATTVVVGTDLYNGNVDGNVAHSVRVGNGNAMGGVPSVMQPVAFTQNSRDEVRQINGDGRFAGALSADAGMHQTNNLAGPVHVQFGRRRSPSESPVANSLHSSESGTMLPAVRQAMQVRRLTPTECAYLQGFPADYLDITFRKKPAADGPKYRALGNSMAVPCMWWLGYRIHHATGPHK